MKSFAFSQQHFHMPTWRADRRTLCSVLNHLVHGSRATVFRSKPCTPTALFLKPRMKNEVSVVLICNENLENTSKLLSFKLQSLKCSLQKECIYNHLSKGCNILQNFITQKIFSKKRCQLKKLPQKHKRVQLLSQQEPVGRS